MQEFLFESRPALASFVCVDKGSLVGWTAFTPFRVKEDAEHTAEMSLYVHGSFRRKGVGMALAHTLLNRASLLDLHCIFAIVFKEMPEVVSFAERNCGFSVAGCLPEVFSDNGKYYDVLVLERLIAPRM
ncbi:putative acetyltransferase (plasmid) [Sinorhizobium sp. CCBAU 05631]|nr:putative acetyltransferase [Sinorhizobium sp. CCBAU 05631]